MSDTDNFEQEQFDAFKKTQKEGLRLISVYHSHPETPARPSDEDIRLAFDPNVSYIIVSLAGEVPDMKSFIIKNKTVEKYKNKKAEEIAGKVVFNGKDTVGFGGTRGEIK